MKTKCIKNFFDPMEEKIYCEYKKIQYLKKDLTTNNDFKSFVVVRNPIDRIISCYFNKIIGKKNGLQKNTMRLNHLMILYQCVLATNFQIYTLMHTFIENKKIDFILKLENINNNWTSMFEKLIQILKVRYY